MITNKKREKIKIKILNKKAVALEFLFWLILGVIILVIAIFVIIILTGKGQAAIEFIKRMFKWGFGVVIIPNRFNKLIVNNKNNKIRLKN